ncbi:oligosaccharide flippase family protein [Halopseudomonas sp.]|uniref:oligosaccharide flippase family protein n=1 Tax=Halopseudomonas sp. TaxID=2901191 RepID=UPI0039E4B453
MVAKYGVVLKNIFWLAVERGGLIASGLLCSALVARSLGVEGYGSFQYGLSLFNVFLALTYFCGAEILVPQFAKDGVDKSVVASNAFAARTLISIIAFSMLCLYLYYADIQNSIFIVVLGIMLLLKEPSGVVIAWLQAETNNKKTALLQVLAAGFKLILVLAIFYLGAGSLEAYATAWLLESALVAALLMVVYRSLKTNSKLSDVSATKVLALIRLGAPFGLAIIFLALMQKIDRLILIHYVDAAQYGVYAVAIQMVENIYLLGNIIIISVAPIFIYKIDNLKAVKRNLLKIVLVMMFSGACICTAFFVLSDSIIALIFGQEFQESASLLRIALLLGWLYFIEIGLSAFFLKYALGKLVVIKYALSLVFVVALALVLIPDFEQLGAIVSLAAGYVLLICLSILMIWKYKEGVYDAKI